MACRAARVRLAAISCGVIFLLFNLKIVNIKLLNIAGELKPLSATRREWLALSAASCCVRHQFILLTFKLKITNKKPCCVSPFDWVEGVVCDWL
jgi:hypothetical protein